MLRALGLADAGDDERLAEVLADRLSTCRAEWVQEAVYSAGGLAVAVSSDTPDHPLVETFDFGDAARALPGASLPASGVRVLDLTRVIAGPIATRTLALLGADVLRVDSPRLAESDDAHADTGQGKRSTLLDLADRADRGGFDELLDAADVVVTGYRPGSLDRLGLSAEAMRERRPGLVVAQLCAWGWSGSWARRRGFDSLVQAANGIAAIEGTGDQPGVLPAQALDHGTGYLLAAAVLRALSERRGRTVRFSLAGTAAWLVREIRSAVLEGAEYSAEPWLATATSAYGELRHALPPMHYDGCPQTWSDAPTRWGTDRPRFRDWRNA
ncbi:CoA transferase [Allokutzneria sp. NRRL B-24872]|uniref:CoA transferase n=1 Tax=Allokutzneria sp. NRRL B-24872 TaxID=1137961 RepID=UPI001FEE6BC8|nr:CoA transferase [Allokutzneria sp. NRRL B-24872]